MSKFQIREDAFGTFRVYKRSRLLWMFSWWNNLGEYTGLSDAEERVRNLIKHEQKEKVVKDITSLD